MTDESGRLTDDQQRMARVMAGMDVARLGDELDQAEVEANSKVAKALFTMATQKNNVAPAIFWMKARAGWREKIEIRPVIETDVTQMTDAELNAEVARLKRELHGAGTVLEGTAQDLDDDQATPRNAHAC